LKLTINRDVFLKELTAALGAAEGKSTIPVLSNVLLETDADLGVLLKTTNLDISFVTMCSATIERHGALCLPAKRLKEVIASAPDAEISIDGSDAGATIKSGRARWKMQGLPKDNFPEIKMPPADFASIPALSLHRALDGVVFAVTTEESRYALSAAKLEIYPNKLRSVATDGHRLALVDVAGDYTVGVDTLIPKKTVAELLKLIAGDPGKVEFAYQGNHLFFRIGSRLLVSREVAGQFPNYDLVIPKDHPHAATVDAGKLNAAIRRASLMADERSRSIKLDFALGKVTVTAQNSEAGEAEESVEIEYAGPEITLGFNSVYLSDFLSRQTGDVRIELKDGGSQIAMKPLGADGSVYVGMPQRL
jgi:DNA polymerase-3 subunit beta